jgi:hypothetical protein
MAGEAPEHGEHYTNCASPFFRVLVCLFPWAKAAILRSFWPLSGGIISERQWTESGNLTLHCLTAWRGLLPRAEEGNGGDGQV